jgi:N-acetylated-alpha-linked acidic dipeptidase
MRGRWVRGRVAVVAACGLVCAGGAGPARAQTGADDLDGFTPGHAAVQRAYEARFQRGVSADDLGRLSRGLSRRPHRVGTENQQAVVRASLAKLRSYGLRARMHTYDVYVSRPERIQVSMTKPSRRRLSVKEKPFPWQRDFRDVVDGYHAYSPPGDVTSQLVYVNYGLPQDYAALDALGVSVAGKIAIVRYGGSFRGVKVHLAEEHGAKGVIIYSDPEDDGYLKGPVYPAGPWRPSDSIQRGSIQFLWEYPGDPLTPGSPSLPGTPRLAPDQAGDLAKIPSTPISYGEARPLLEALRGPEAPEAFQGGLPFRYHVGPGPTEARLNLDIAYDQEPVSDAIAVIRGRKHPDEKVVIGGHSDAWTYGAADNVSGWTAVMEIGRSLGRLMRRGWRPDRTIVLAGWDGEEYGLLGSTEFGEQFRRDIGRNVVAYINMDGVAGRRFSAGGVPSLDKTIIDVTRSVEDPGGGSIYSAWAGDAPTGPTLNRLGSGSDYTVFLDHLGAPSMEVGYSTPSGEYHSAYDDTYQVEHFLDPGYLSHQAASRTSGLTALRLANADALPLRYSDYARAVDGYVAELQEIQAGNPDAAQVDLSALRDAAQAWGAAATALEARSAALVSAGRPSRRALRRINRALMRQERLLTTRQGIPGRPWFRHQIYAPGVNTGYAAQFLPGIRDALDAGDAATVSAYRDLLLDSLRRVTATAAAAAGRNAASAAATRSFGTRSTAAGAASARRSARDSAREVQVP